VAFASFYMRPGWDRSRLYSPEATQAVASQVASCDKIRGSTSAVSRTVTEPKRSGST
jgi:hypothetical protein